MAKLVINDVTSGFYSTTALNNAFTAIETALENTVSRDGTSPNQLTSNLDLNGHLLLNQANPITVTGFVWEGVWLTGTTYSVGDTIFSPLTGSAYICIVAHVAGNFATDLAALKWQVVAEASLPTQAGNAAKFIQTDGSIASWQVPDATEVSFTQLGTGASVRTVQTKIQEYVSVKDFGAVGDGVTNDYTAIQNAYNYLITLGGGSLYIPQGTYIVNSTLVFGGTGTNQNSANIHVYGAGGFSTILDFSGSTVGTDGVQISGASRIRLQGFTIKSAKNFGLNINAGQNPGDPTYVSRFAIQDLIVDSSTSHGIRLANTYMGLLENIESRNNGGNGFYFAGNHTSINAIRCWAGGDGVNPLGGNGLHGWSINGLIYSNFIGCGSDWNNNTGYRISNCGGVTFSSCGAESNKNEGFYIEASSANATGVPVTGIKGVTLNGCFGYNNSLILANSFANFVGITTANSMAANVTVSNCTDLLNGGQTISVVANGASGTITLFDTNTVFSGTYSYTGTVINGNFLQNTKSSAGASTLTSAVVSNAGSPAVSLTLTPGDWDVYGIADFLPAATTSITNLTAGISTTSATFGGQDTYIASRFAAVVPAASVQIATPTVRIRVTSTTTVYLVVVSVFTVSTMQAFGSIYAKRA